MRARVLLDRWGDLAIALVLLGWIQLDLWGHAPETMRVVGGRGVLAVLLLFVTLPLAIRRRAPAATLLVAAASLVVASALVRHSQGAPVEVFIAMLVAFYSVGAHCDDRRAPVIGALALAAIAAADLARPDAASLAQPPNPMDHRTDPDAKLRRPPDAATGHPSQPPQQRVHEDQSNRLGPSDAGLHPSQHLESDLV
jgi:hypothetical protein